MTAPIRHQPHAQQDPVTPAAVTTSSTVQYNAEGYALSSTYAAGDVQHVNRRPPQQGGTGSTIPPPRIQGTTISLDTPEDIAKWIAERKKRWPTAANVEKNKFERPVPSSSSSPSAPRNEKKRKRNDRDSAAKCDHKVVPRPATGQSDPQPTTLSTQSGPQAKEHDAEPRSRQVPASSLDIALAALSGDYGGGSTDPVAARQAEHEDAGAMTELPIIPGPGSNAAADSTSDGSTSTSESDSDDSIGSLDDEEGGDDGDDDRAPVAVSSKLGLEESMRPVAVDKDGRVGGAFARPKRPCKYFRQGRCTRGEDCTFSHAVVEGGTGRGARNDKSAARGGGRQQQGQGRGQPSSSSHPARVDDRYKWRKRKSLFDRLMENEVEREKAVAAEQARLDDQETSPVTAA